MEKDLTQDELSNLLGLNETSEAQEGPSKDGGDTEAPKEEIDDLLEDASPVSEDNDDGEAESQKEETTEGDSSLEAEGQEEEVALDKRLEEFEKQFVKKEEEASLRGQLQSLESQVKQLEATFSQTQYMDSLPQGGVFQKDGKSIYEMNATEINDYLVELRDNAQEFAAGKVQKAYSDAIDTAYKYQSDRQRVLEAQKQLQDATDHVEWTEVKQEISSHLKELTQDDYNNIAQYITNQAANPVYAAALTNKAGKTQKAVEALQSLGILKRLRDALGTETKKTSALPDSKAGSKKVKQSTGKSSHRIDEVAKMSQASFNKLSEAELDKILGESFA